MNDLLEFLGVAGTEVPDNPEHHCYQCGAFIEYPQHWDVRDVTDDECDSCSESNGGRCVTGSPGLCEHAHRPMCEKCWVASLKVFGPDSEG